VNPIKINTALFKFLTTLVFSAFIFMLASAVFHVHNVDIKTRSVSFDELIDDETRINQTNSSICYLIHYFTSNYNLDLIEIENDSLFESVILVSHSNSIPFQSSFHNKIKLRGPPKTA